MPKKIIATESAPQAIGPYSQANVVSATDLVFCSGQIALDPATGKLIESGITEQTKQVLRNLRAILEAAGSDLNHVVKTTVYLKDMNDFKAMNEAYAQFFTDNPPARAAVEVARLPLDVLVEIEAIGLVKAE